MSHRCRNGIRVGENSFVPPATSEDHGRGQPHNYERSRRGALADTYKIRNDLIWPTRLTGPPRPPALVYLDQFVYVRLAQAAAGAGRPGYAELLDTCRRSRVDGRALFPLSSTHILELYETARINHRRDLVEVMEQLSDFNCILGRPEILELEIEAALAELPTVTMAPKPPIALVGPSVLWPFGERGLGFKFEGASTDEAAWWAEQLCQDMGIDPGADAAASVHRWMERQLITGPENHDDPELKKFGYRVDVWRTGLEQRAEQERYLVQQLDADPQMRRGRLRDVVNGREMFIELKGILDRATAALNTSFAELLGFAGLTEEEMRSQEVRTKVRDFSDRMPSTRVAVSVKERYHRDNRHNWASNDIHDIDAVAIAIPYCDAVFVDKAARNAVDQAKELRVFGTFLPRGPEELTEWLDDVPAPSSILA